MKKSRLEWTVGLFVFLGLVLLAALLLEFSKGLTFLRPTTNIQLHAENVAGLKPRAAVLMSGVQIGTVSDITLDPSGTNVTITLSIYKPYEVHTDARFVFEQSGFLGDQYVAIIPGTNGAPVFKPGEWAVAETPFNLQEFTRSASGFIGRIDETVKKLNELLLDVTTVVLKPQTLTNVSITVANLKDFSNRALLAVDNLNAVLATNSPALATSGSNLVVLSQQATQFVSSLNGILATNAPDLDASLKNIEASTEILKKLLGEVQAGKGVAGQLLQDDKMSAQLSQIAHNLSITSSNLNRLGVWGILWQHKPPKTNEPPSPPRVASPKDKAG